MKLNSSFNLAISSKDLCNTCIHCVYVSNGLSTCKLNWPTEPDENLEITKCEKHKISDK